MPESRFQLAQINIARMRAPLTDPIMAEFVENLASINALADASPGFVWRLQSEAGDATNFRPYDEPILVNLSVWENPEVLRDYVFRSQHVAIMRKRKQWFAKFEDAYTALWWVPLDCIPTVEEAKARLEHLRVHGESPYAFSFKKLFPSPQSE